MFEKEKGESAEETALREVKEETELDGEIIENIGKIHYTSLGATIFQNCSFLPSKVCWRNPK
ncbi:MAG: NUDIX domain-containing protein [Candidatus Bathyarchaeia archaeon]|nr:NUDIX domain-containing protein [Candidatus Bathyarchaeia archaeon]